METVSDFILGGFKITANGDCPGVLSVQLSCLVLVNSCCFVTTNSHPISSTQAACWAYLGSPSLYCYLTLSPQAVKQAIAGN